MHGWLACFSEEVILAPCWKPGELSTLRPMHTLRSVEQGLLSLISSARISTKLGVKRKMPCCLRICTSHRWSRRGTLGCSRVTLLDLRQDTSSLPLFQKLKLEYHNIRLCAQNAIKRWFLQSPNKTPTEDEFLVCSWGFLLWHQRKAEAPPSALCLS